jgi:hypothetical protein
MPPLAHRTNMRPALLIASAALAFSIAGQCFSQQTAPTDQQEVEAVIIKLYKQIVLRKPLGLLSGNKLEAIRPFLSRDLIERIRVTAECEKDFDRQYPYDPNLPMKPPFVWLEAGLFSGDNERADPLWFGVRRIVRQNDGSYEAYVKLKRWEEFDKYPRPRGPKYDDTWEITVFVVRDGDHYAVNDVFYARVYADHSISHYPAIEETRLSQLLDSGCKAGKWVGYPGN